MNINLLLFAGVLHLTHYVNEWRGNPYPADRLPNYKMRAAVKAACDARQKKKKKK
jgi:hypothetical protein